jgi:hypothetical protein
MNAEGHQVIHHIVLRRHGMKYVGHHVSFLRFGYSLKAKVRRVL